MSAQTLKMIEDAIAAHLADESEGAVLVGYVAMAAFILPGDDGLTYYQKLHIDPTPFHVQMGLSAYLHSRMQGEAVTPDDDE